MKLPVGWPWIDDAVFNHRLRKLQASRDRDVAHYSGIRAEARADKDWDAVGRAEQEEYMEVSMIDEEIDHLTTRHHLRQAERLLVPIPPHPDRWEKGQFLGRNTLTREGLAEIRATLRKERADRSAHVFAWGGFLIGIIGALTGLAAVILNR